ncbi:chemotaxis protein CheX [Bacillus tianshenii]|nr:chemotaxis protein CheX [Bacillus tianshenii]
MSIGVQVTSILNGTIEAVNSIIPVELHIDKPSLMTQPLQQSSIGVLIGMTGDVRGRIVIVGDESTLSNIGEIMFGMPLEGEMLQSFTGELGNMIAGNISTNISQKGLTTDITPPTVMVGQTKMYGFDRAFRVPVNIQDKGEIQIILMIEEKK